MGPTSNQGLASKHTVQVQVTGSPSAATLKLEGSTDGTNWADLSPTLDILVITMFHVIDRVVQFVRVNVVTLTGGSDPTVTANYLGDK